MRVRKDILVFIMFSGFVGFMLGAILGLIGIVIATAIVFFLGKCLYNDNDSDSISIGKSMFMVRPIRIRLRYRCLSCYHTYTGKREYPKCGSKLKQVEF